MCPRISKEAGGPAWSGLRGDRSKGHEKPCHLGHSQKGARWRFGAEELNHLTLYFKSLSFGWAENGWHRGPAGSQEVQLGGHSLI